MTPREGQGARDPRDESFIPWEQIAPLVKPGMTAIALKRAIFQRLGLSADRYRAMWKYTPDISIAERIRLNGGVEIRKTRPDDEHFMVPDDEVIA